MDKRSIIVVGGGIAGLTAAYTLQEDGFDVQVLEREAVAGGRMRGERARLDSGARVLEGDLSS